MAISEFEAPPAGEPLASDPKFKEILMGKNWLLWIYALINRVGQTSETITIGGAVSLRAQAASISPTAAAIPLDAGVYRVSWGVCVEQVASGTSAIQITIGMTRNGQHLSFPGANLTGNLLTSADTGVVTMRCDPGTQITYTATYASTGGTPMQYGLDVCVEALAR